MGQSQESKQIDFFPRPLMIGSKARTANCDTALKDALSFISDKKPAVDGEKDSQWARPAQLERSNPSNTEPSSQCRQKNPSDPQQPREIPMDRGDIPMECRRESHHGAHENPAAQGDPHGQRRDLHGAQKKRVHHGAHENIPRAAKAEAKKLHKYSSTSLYNTDRTAGIKAMSSVATQTNSFQDHLGEISEIVHIDSFQDPSYLAAADNSEEFRTFVDIDSFQDPSQMVTFDFFQDPSEEEKRKISANWLLSRPSQWPIQQFIRNWHLSRPLWYIKLTHFQDPMLVYSTKMFKLTHFKTPAHSMGNYLQIDSVKSPWETSFIKIGYFKTILYSESWIHFKTLASFWQCFNSPWETSLEKVNFFQDHPTQWISDSFQDPCVSYITFGQWTHFKTIWKRKTTENT